MIIKSKWLYRNKIIEMKMLKGKEIQIDENRSIAIAKTPEGGYQITAQNKIEGRKWKTCKCERDENNIVTTTIHFTEDGAEALVQLLIEDLIIQK